MLLLSISSIWNWLSANSNGRRTRGVRVNTHSPLVISVLLFLPAEKRGAPNQGTKDKDGEELDQVAGNVEDEIGDRISGIREMELLYGPDSLLAVYGPMIVHICGSPHKFKVRILLISRYNIKTLVESNSAWGRYPSVQQVPVCQFAVL